MAVVDPGIARRDALERTTRLARRVLALAAYAACVAALFVALGPLFADDGAEPVVLPKPVKAEIYKTKAGDTLETVAARHGLSLPALLALNPATTSVALEPGTKLRVG